MSDVKVFLSYVEDEAGWAAASSLRDDLVSAYIEAITAPHMIPIGDVWENRIREFLEDSAALIAIGTTGFSKSPWCQQEIGWALGRHRPVLWVEYDKKESPCGFLARHQALRVASASDLGSSVTDWLCRQEETRPLLAQSWIDELEVSDSFASSERLARLLSRLEAVSSEQWERIKGASVSNRQVGSAHVGPKRARYWPTLIEWLESRLEVTRD